MDNNYKEKIRHCRVQTGRVGCFQGLQQEQISMIGSSAKQVLICEFMIKMDQFCVSRHRSLVSKYVTWNYLAS